MRAHGVLIADPGKTPSLERYRCSWRGLCKPREFTSVISLAFIFCDVWHLSWGVPHPLMAWDGLIIEFVLGEEFIVKQKRKLPSP